MQTVFQTTLNKGRIMMMMLALFCLSASAQSSKQAAWQKSWINLIHEITYLDSATIVECALSTWDMRNAIDTTLTRHQFADEFENMYYTIDSILTKQCLPLVEKSDKEGLRKQVKAIYKDLYAFPGMTNAKCCELSSALCSLNADCIKDKKALEKENVEVKSVLWTKLSLSQLMGLDPGPKLKELTQELIKLYDDLGMIEDKNRMVQFLNTDCH